MRTADEFAAGHIPDAVNLDYYSATFEQDLLALEGSKSYLIYCRSGKRLSGATVMMQALGFTGICDLEGGFQAWQAADTECDN